MSRVDPRHRPSRGLPALRLPDCGQDFDTGVRRDNVSDLRDDEPFGSDIRVVKSSETSLQRILTVFLLLWPIVNRPFSKPH